MTDYDHVADAFMAARSDTIGVAAVRAWARGIPAGGRVLDLGCGHGIPIARTMAKAGLVVHGAFDDHERGPDDDLRLQFEAVSRFDPDDKQVVRAVLQSLILQHEAKRWAAAS